MEKEQNPDMVLRERIECGIRIVDDKRRYVMRGYRPGFFISGVVLLLTVAFLCIPVTVPRAFGYQIYAALTDDMAPDVKAGSLVYIRAVDGEEIERDEKVAYYSSDGGGVVLRRVVENNPEEEQLTIHGELDDEAEYQTVEYSRILGVAEAVIPRLGDYMSLAASTAGTAVLAAITALAMLLIVIGIQSGSGNEGGR